MSPADASYKVDQFYNNCVITTNSPEHGVEYSSSSPGLQTSSIVMNKILITTVDIKPDNGIIML